MPTIQLPRQLLLRKLGSKDEVENSVIDTSRWSTHYEFIFKHDGKVYRTYYKRGATEMQDEEPWEYEDMVDCDEVKKVEVTKYEWVAVKDAE